VESRKASVLEDPLVHRDRGRDPLDHVFAERAEHAMSRLFAVGAGDDQLREHRVVCRRDLAASVTPESTRTNGPPGST
jgi:hypothetical protein